MPNCLDFERIERRMRASHRTVLDFLMTHKIPPKMYYDWKKGGDPRISSVEKLSKALGYKIELVPVVKDDNDNIRPLWNRSAAA